MKYNYTYNNGSLPQLRSQYKNSSFIQFRDSILSDGGSIDEQQDLRDFIALSKIHNMYDSIEFAMLGAYKLDSGRVTKAYSFDDVPNNAVQTTESLQPFQAGHIAPNEKRGIKNPNGAGRYMTHPTISFASDEAWSVSTILNSYNSSATALYYAGKSSNGTGIGVKTTGMNILRFRNELTGGIQTSQAIANFVNKQKLITWVADGLGGLFVYVNGTLIESFSINTISDFNIILAALPGTMVYQYGSILSHTIRRQALTPTQITAEYNLFKTRGYLGYEGTGVPGVKIGDQVWQTSNCDMAATPMGTVITNVTNAATWVSSQTLYDNAYAATVGTDDEKIYAGCLAAAMWCYYNNDASLGAVYGKLYNWFAVKLLQLDIDAYNTANPTTPWGWRVPTENDFNTLATTLGGASVAGGKMKVAGTDYWLTPNTGADNSSGFSVLGGGTRESTTGIFQQINIASRLHVVDSYLNRFVLYNSQQLSTSGSNDPRWGSLLRLIKS